MPLTYNGITIPTNIDAITYNGNNIDIVKYNGATIWEKIKAYITYDKNATMATGTMNKQQAGENIVLSSNLFERANCNFLGWSTDSAASSATYEDNAIVSIADDTTLYAIWQMKYSQRRVININGLVIGKTKSYTSDYFDLCSASSVKIVRNNGYLFYGFGINIEGGGSLSYPMYDYKGQLESWTEYTISIPEKYKNKRGRFRIWSISESATHDDDYYSYIYVYLNR